MSCRVFKSYNLDAHEVRSVGKSPHLSYRNTKTICTPHKSSHIVTPLSIRIKLYRSPRSISSPLPQPRPYPRSHDQPYLYVAGAPVGFMISHGNSTSLKQSRGGLHRPLSARYDGPSRSPHRTRHGISSLRRRDWMRRHGNFEAGPSPYQVVSPPRTCKFVTSWSTSRRNTGFLGRYPTISLK